MKIVAADPAETHAMELIRALDDDNRQRYPGEPVFGIDAEGFVDNGGVFLLGYVDEKAVASGALRPLQNGAVEVKRMYVRPEYRGRGLSREMLAELESIAADDGVRVLRLETGVKQPEALGLYRSVGFAATPLYEPYVGSRFSVCFAKPLPTREDVEFLRCFEACTLPEPEWTHLAHVRMAWLYLSRMDSTAALKKIRDGIKRFNAEVLDRRQEYHETVTVAFSRIISDRMCPDEAWESFAARIDDIADRDSPMLDSYYSSGLLSLVETRDRFVEPDLHDLPEFRDAPKADEVGDG